MENTLEEKAKEHFKEWGSICRVFPKDKSFPITYDQLIDYASSFASQQVKEALEELKTDTENLKYLSDYKYDQKTIDKVKESILSIQNKY